MIETGFNVGQIRKEFPALHQEIHGRPLAYLDNAATSQKPQSVLDSLAEFYSQYNANVHRGIHTLSEKATAAYEGARTTVQKHLNAADEREIIFVRGTTEAINLVAQSYGRPHLKAGDEILITWMEHHSNIVPWQILCEQTGAVLRVAPINDQGELILEEFERLLNGKTKIVSVAHVSNALGTINPVKEIVQMSHARGAVVLLDGAQAVPHLNVDVRETGCDFYAFSGHKAYGPTGIGVLYGRKRILEKMPPYQGGGEMISAVTFERTTYNQIPHRFEAGTPHISGAIGLGAALRFIHKVGMQNISNHEAELLEYGTGRISEVPGVRLIGTAANKSSVVSFVMDAIHAHDLGTILDREGVAVRAGHHCAMPVMQRFDVPATVRASFALYNTKEEIDRLADGLQNARKIFGV